MIAEEINEDLEGFEYIFHFYRCGNIVFLRGDVKAKKDAPCVGNSIPKKYLPMLNTYASVADLTANVIDPEICFLTSRDVGTWAITDPYWWGNRTLKAGHVYRFSCTYIVNN